MEEESSDFSSSHTYDYDEDHEESLDSSHEYDDIPLKSRIEKLSKIRKYFFSLNKKEGTILRSQKKDVKKR